MKTKKLSKKLIVSVVGLVLAIVFSTLSTYAWFSVNRDVEATGINLNVRAGDDALFISQTNGSGYDISTVIDMTEQFEVELSDITWNGTNFVDRKNNVATAATASVTGQYFTIPLYFRSNKAGSVALTDTANRSNVTPTGDGSGLDYKTAWGALAAGDYLSTAIANEADLETRAAYAARVMFDNGTTKAIWEPNSTEAFGAGRYNMAQDWLAGFTGNTVLGENYTNPSYDAYKDREIEDVALATLTETGVGTGIYECTITVSIWIEGWDADCFDSILEDIFDVALCFTIVRYSATAPTNLQITGASGSEVLSWDTVDGATGYQVSINNIVYTVDSADIGFNGYDISSYITDAGYYAIKVRAIMDGTTYHYSPWSTEYTLDTRTQLATPANISVDNVGQLTFDAVANATSYTVIITDDNDNDTEVARFTALTNSYNLAALDLNASDYTITIYASAANYKSSEEAEHTWEWEKPTQLATPANLKLANGILTWDAVTNATSYLVTIDNSIGDKTAATATYNLADASLTVGETYTITVKAIGDGTNYLNSEVSTITIVYGTEA